MRGQQTTESILYGNYKRLAKKSQKPGKRKMSMAELRAYPTIELIIKPSLKLIVNNGAHSERLELSIDSWSERADNKAIFQAVIDDLQQYNQAYLENANYKQYFSVLPERRQLFLAQLQTNFAR